MEPKTKNRILVLCTGNSCRSQMAEGWIRHDLGGSMEVFSAGLSPSRVHPMAISVMAEAGIDLSGHRSKSLTEFHGQAFDLVVTVCDSAREACPLFPGTKKQIHESFSDPALYGATGEDALGHFREVRDEIRARLIGRIQRELLPD